MKHIFRIEVIKERQDNEPPVWFYDLLGCRQPDWAFFSCYDGKIIEISIREIAGKVAKPIA